MDSGEAGNGYEYLLRRLGELQEDARELQPEVDRLSMKARVITVTGT
ncbi:MAG: hypothetical protein JRN06_03930 [Nitrososphaerota archaeon]|nr:hypothetical protein [Nitrososphaerota archaeon]MDG7023769.1 hypothetical protein [Nitrososphaerota archaeon]